jgi:benzoyl-CoA reductase subunit B
VMDIPVISNQWWSAYIAAKQLSPHYLRVLDEKGFPEESCRYCSLGLACTLDGDPARAPWGGLPRPTVITARLTCDCIQRVFSHWARAMNTSFYPFEAPGWTHKDPRWFEHSRTRWREVYEARRIDLHAEEMKGLIRFLEGETGRTFDDGKLATLMRRINEQEELLYETALLCGAARPCPVGIADQIPNVMIPQWHRGSDWAIEHARRFRDEVKERVARGIGASERERIRMMWIGAGVLQRARRATRGRLRLVDVPALRRPAVPPRRSRRPAARSRQPDLRDERGPAFAALDERMDGE